MNKIVKQQLSSCKVADIPSFDDNTTHIFIPKNSSKAVNQYHLHKYYMIEIQDYIINPPPDFTLAANWNKGTNPPSKYMNVEIMHIQGKMVLVSGVSYNPDCPSQPPIHWEGWLPQRGLNIIKQL